MGGQEEVVGEKQEDVLGEHLSLRGQGMDRVPGSTSGDTSQCLRVVAGRGLQT